MLLNLLDLAKFQFNRGRAHKNGDRYTDARFLVIHVFNVAVEVRERTVLDPNHFAHFEKRFRTRFFHAFLHLRHDLFHFTRRDRARAITRPANETGHLGSIFYQVPRLVRHFHFYVYIARKETTLCHRLVTALHFHNLFGWDEDLTKLILHAGAVDALLKRTLHALLHTGVGVHDVPTFSAR